MNAQFIKDGMSKTPWDVKEYSMLRRDEIASEDVIIVDCYMGPEEMKEGNINAEAIVIAVNNTYAQNIDPTKVPEMYKMLEGVAVGLGNLLAVVNDTTAATIRSKIIEIETLLTSAKLS